MEPAIIKLPAHVPSERVVDFDIYHPAGFKKDYHAAWKVLQEPGVPEIVWTPKNGGHWIATRNTVIRDVMADYGHFANSTQIFPKSAVDDYVLLPTTLDPPAHKPYRNLLNSSLSPKAVSGVESKIRELAVELVESIAANGKCDFIADYAHQFPVRIFFSLVDLPIAEAAKAKTWSDEMLRPPPGVDWSPDKSGFARGLRMFSEYLEPYIDARLGGTGQDMLSRLINGKVNGRPLTRDEALQLSVQMLIAGLDTVVNFLGFAMLFLARNPDQRLELVHNPSLIPDAIEELIRRFPIVVIGREVVEDMDYRGVQLKKGELIATPTPLGGIDETENEDAMEVDFHRRGGEHVTFGNGPHRCPGAHLARTEVRITLEEWLKRIPDFEVEPGHDVTFTGGGVAVVNALPLRW
jgi:camphor 5-monooxygenase